MKLHFVSVAASIAAAQQCPASLLEGLKCRTDDSAVISIAPAKSREECCAACSATEGCSAFVFESNFLPSFSKCTLKTYCKEIEKGRSISDINIFGMNVSTTGVVSGTVPVSKPQPYCPVNYLSAGYNCEGGTIQTVAATSIADCCEKCQQVEGCLMFSRSKLSGQCDLKSECPSKVLNFAYDTAWRSQEEPASWDYKVGLGAFKVPDYQCGDQDGTTLIFYPEPKTQNEKFHVVVYAHGLGGHLDDGGNVRGLDNGLDSWMQDVASVGLIVIAPFTGNGFPAKGCGAEYQDMLLALNYTMANPSLHPALASADWSRVGAFGHSMGGSAATRIAKYGQDSGLNVVAAVASHGAASVTKLTVPVLFTTGTLDTKDHDAAGYPGHFKHEFELCASPDKVFVNLRGGYHMEPSEGKRLNFLTAQFLSCHVNQNDEHCEYIYHRDGLCSRKDLEECVIVQTKEVTV